MLKNDFSVEVSHCSESPDTAKSKSGLGKRARVQTAQSRSSPTKVQT